MKKPNEIRREQVQKHIDIMNLKYPIEIAYSIQYGHWVHSNQLDPLDANIGISTKCEDDIRPISILKGKSNTIELMATTTDKAIFDCKQKNNTDVCILDFASYRKPGGGYLEGARAQEEALCEVSTLYNVLSNDAVRPIYELQKKKLNHMLYLNSAICLPDIVFESSKERAFADVIVCAAPNVGVSTPEQPLQVCQDVMEERINFVLKVASNFMAETGSTTLILGAFGCGVFRNDPEFVAKSFKKALDGEYKGVFPRVVFAVPDETSVNYKAFEKVFK